MGGTPILRAAAGALILMLIGAACRSGDGSSQVASTIPPPRPMLPDGWRWLEVPGAAIGVPNAMESPVGTDGSGQRPTGASARAMLPTAFHYAVSIEGLSLPDPRTGNVIVPKDLDEYRSVIEARYDRDPQLAAINGGRPRFETVGQTGSLAIVRSGAVSGSGDVSTTEWLVEIPNGGVLRFTVEIYIEDLSRYGRPPLADYLATIWVDQNTWVPPR